MKAVKLIIRLVIYYGLLSLLVWLALKVFPGWQEYLPVGRLQSLIADAGAGSGGSLLGDKNAMAAGASATFAHIKSLGGSLIWMASAMAGALLVSLPVSWVYMNVRTEDEYDQSLIGTIIILPIVVAGVVVLVQDSLALAFSLAGIAAVVRFRNTMKSPGDLVFILLAIGIGLSSGVGAVELATMLSVGFNLTFVGMWVTQYGERHYMKRYLSDFNPNDEHSVKAAAVAAEAAKAKKKSKAEAPPAQETAAEVPLDAPPAEPPAAS